MPVQWTLPETPDEFREWLEACPVDTEMGMAGGYKKHPIPLWFAWRGHEVIISALGTCPGVYFWDVRSKSLTNVPADHWIARFYRALMLPDAYRTVTAGEALFCLARILNQPCNT